MTGFRLFKAIDAVLAYVLLLSPTPFCFCL